MLANISYIVDTPKKAAQGRGKREIGDTQCCTSSCYNQARLATWTNHAKIVADSLQKLIITSERAFSPLANLLHATQIPKTGARR